MWIKDTKGNGVNLLNADAIAAIAPDSGDQWEIRAYFYGAETPNYRILSVGKRDECNKFLEDLLVRLTRESKK